MKSLSETIAELNAMKHGNERDVVQKIVESLSEIDRRITLLEQSRTVPEIGR
jgi:hypothetical protein